MTAGPSGGKQNMTRCLPASQQARLVSCAAAPSLLFQAAHVGASFYRVPPPAEGQAGNAAPVL